MSFAVMSILWHEFYEMRNRLTRRPVLCDKIVF
jgi:predicted outer membrane lipoprotein